MKRKLVFITIFYVIGLLWGLYYFTNITFIFCLFILSVCAYIFRKNKLIVFAIVILIISCLFNNYIKNKYDNAYTNLSNSKIEGIVIKEDGQTEYYKKYVVQVKNVDGCDDLKNTNLLIYVKINSSADNIKFGDKIYMNCTVEKGNVSRNYNGFDYNEYLKSKKIYGVSYIESTDIKIIQTGCVSTYKKILNKFYETVKQKIYLILADDTADVCMALILGDKSNVDNEIIDNFSDSSLSHILAISGMHMSYIIMIFSYLFIGFGKFKKNIFLIFVIIIFCNLVGNSESILRASIMSIVYIISKLIYRKSDSLTNICISALVILIINPYSITSISFLLSFGGTLGIILFYKCIESKLSLLRFLEKNKFTNYIKQCMSVSISANIVIIPVIIIYFNKMSLIFIISNIFASALLTIIMPLIFICIFISFLWLKFSKILAIALIFSINCLIKISNISSKITMFNFIVCTPYKITIITYYIIAFLLLLKFNSKNNIKKIIQKIIKICIVCYLIICLIINLVNFFDKNLYIYFIDVGQGDSTLIITPNNKKLLIDGGGSEFGDDYIGENVLMPYLLDRKISSLDYIMISHFDSDHCKGILYILENLKVKNIIISKQGEQSENYSEFVKIVNEKRINVIIVQANMKLQIDTNVYLNILWPEEDLIKENILNNNSIVAKLVYGNFSMLFTGDIEEKAENEIIQKYNLKSDILKVAHHGSKTSTSIEFLEKVNPKIALIGVGEDNNYGHPAEITLTNLENIGCYVYRTDLCGEISLAISKNGKYKLKTHI